MTTQAHHTFTPADVAYYAELIRPYLRGTDHADVHAAVVACEADRIQDVMDRVQRVGGWAALASMLSGTYDEFRAEGGAS